MDLMYQLTDWRGQVPLRLTSSSVNYKYHSCLLQNTRQNTVMGQLENCITFILSFTEYTSIDFSPQKFVSKLNIEDLGFHKEYNLSHFA